MTTHVVAQMDQVYLTIGQEFAEIQLWTNDGPSSRSTVLFASNGIYRDSCDYKLYFGSWRCPRPGLVFYVNV